MCSSWTDRTWKLAEKRRTYASRKWVMSKKKKRSQAMSDLSDDGKLDGNTTPHGPAALGRTHPAGNSKGTCTQRSVSPPVTGQLASGHLPTGQEDITDRSPVKWALHMVVQVSQLPVTCHPATGHLTWKI